MVHLKVSGFSVREDSALALGELAREQCPMWVAAQLLVDVGVLDGLEVNVLRGSTSQEAYYHLLDRGWSVERRRSASTGEWMTVVKRAPYAA